MRRPAVLTRPVGGKRTPESEIRNLRRVTEDAKRETLSGVEALTERVDTLTKRADAQDAEIATIKAELARRKGGRPKKANRVKAAK